MTELKEEELLEQLNNAFHNSNLWLKQEGILEGFIKKKKQAFKQIAALIKKPEITEEWYGERARELIIKLDLIGCPISIRKAREFIHSFVEEIIKKEEQRGV